MPYSAFSWYVIFIKYSHAGWLTLVLLNKLRCHAHFYFSANQITWSRLLVQIQIFNGKQCRSRSVGFRQLIWIYTVCQGRVYPGSAGLGLMAQSHCGIEWFCVHHDRDKVNKRTQELVQSDPHQAPTPKGKTDKYNKSATNWTDGKQSW